MSTFCGGVKTRVRGWKPSSVGREECCRFGLFGAMLRCLRDVDCAVLLGDLGVSQGLLERDGDPDGEMIQVDSLER